jgi:hypothetical protein
MEIDFDHVYTHSSIINKSKSCDIEEKKENKSIN